MSEGKILVVEDDREIGEIIVLYLEQSGFKVLIAADGEQAIRLFAEEQPDLILLDVMLPDMSGIDICKEVRKQSDVPIIYLSCKQDAEDIIEALQEGGDDYLTKPFNPAVLATQVKDKLLRMKGKYVSQDERYTLKCNKIEVNLLSYETYVDGRLVQLLDREVQLLIYFMQHPNRICSIDELHQRIWGHDSLSGEAAVIVQISNLRKKIEPDPSQPKYILTVRGAGYKFRG